MGRRSISAALLALLLAGAAYASAQTPAEAEGAAAPSEVFSISGALEDETFRYNPAGRRDPFKSLLQLQSKQKDLSSLPPVQQLDLAQIKITGVVMDEVEGPRAMIKSPTGRTFVVKKGMIIGKNEGEIIEVSLQGIRVVEKFVDFIGKETLRETFIKTRSKTNN